MIESITINLLFFTVSVAHEYENELLNSGLGHSWGCSHTIARQGVLLKASSLNGQEPGDILSSGIALTL